MKAKIIANKEVCMRCKIENGYGWTDEDEKRFVLLKNIICPAPDPSYKMELVDELPDYCKYKLEHTLLLPEDKHINEIC